MWLHVGSLVATGNPSWPPRFAAARQKRHLKTTANIDLVRSVGRHIER